MKGKMALLGILALAAVSVAIALSPRLQNALYGVFLRYHAQTWIEKQRDRFLAGDFRGCARFSFPDGSWIVLTNEHSCCTGAGFDCVVALDSKGVFRIDPNKNFCGREGLENCLGRIAASSVEDFYGKALREGLDFK